MALTKNLPHNSNFELVRLFLNDLNIQFELNEPENAILFYWFINCDVMEQQDIIYLTLPSLNETTKTN